MKRRSGKLLDVMPYRHQEWIEEPDGEISITTYQDVTPTIEQNKKNTIYMGIS